MLTRVVVIGAGWNGLVTAKTYLQVDPSIELTILEAESTLGGTWSKDRIYPELLSQQPYGMYEAADLFMEKRDPDQSGGYIPSSRIHSYLEEYASQWNLADKIRYSADVERVQRTSDGRWGVYIHTQSEALVCDKLIVATGQTSLPNIPEISSDNFTPPTFHSRYLGQHLDTLKAPAVTTVAIYGAGKSAYDAATVALLAGKKVQWVIRSSGEGPCLFIEPQFLGRDASDAAFTPALSSFYPDPLNEGFSYRFFHSGRNKLGYWLNWKFWDMTSKQTFATWKYDESEGMRKLKPKLEDHALYWCNPPPYPVPRTEVIDEVRKGERVTVHRADIIHLSGSSIQLSDGTSLETDMLIYCTGYAAHQKIFSEKDAYELGLPVLVDHLPTLDKSYSSHLAQAQAMDDEVVRRFPRLKVHPMTQRQPKYTQYRLYRWSVPLGLLQKEDRSLAFVGLLQGSGIAVIAEASALWATAWLTGDMNINREMKDVEWEVDYLNAFARKRYGDIGKEAPVSVFEWWTQTQEMLKEVGVVGPKISLFKPWLPASYRGLVEKWMAGKKPREANEEATRTQVTS